jgi:hypothetical protein
MVQRVGEDIMTFGGFAQAAFAVAAAALASSPVRADFNDDADSP